MRADATNSAMFLKDLIYLYGECCLAFGVQKARISCAVSSWTVYSTHRLTSLGGGENRFGARRPHGTHSWRKYLSPSPISRFTSFFFFPRIIAYLYDLLHFIQNSIKSFKKNASLRGVRLAFDGWAVIRATDLLKARSPIRSLSQCTFLKKKEQLRRYSVQQELILS